MPPPDKRAPLMRPDWDYVAGASLEALTPADWALLDRQRAAYLAARQADQVLANFSALGAEPSFGYEITMYAHGLQTATLMLRDGLDEETIVVGLLHDIAYDTAPETHGAVAAAMLGPYCADRHEWMLRHHQIFQAWHFTTLPGAERDGRERFRGHPHFEWTARFVARYDQTTIRADFECLPIAAFEPMVRRFYAKAPRRIDPAG